jgi:ribosomal protein L21E
MAVKVVIENAVLRGSQHDQFWQKVGTVYLDGGEEFNVVAPSQGQQEMPSNG